MKKLIAIVLCFAMILSLSLCFVACSKEDSFTISTALLSDSGYDDYASEVVLNFEKYPQLSDQGLFLMTGLDEYGSPTQVSAIDKNNIENEFDENLPSLIIVHGVQLGNGRYGNIYWKTENQGDAEEMGNYFRSGENFEQQKWNVFYFHYEKFADAKDGIGFNGASSMDAGAVEDRVWTRGANGQGSAFVLADGNYSETDALKYSIAEFFAAEYIRTMKAICEVFPNYEKNHQEIRTASHSMGGALTVATVSLLNILCHDGQIERSLLPNRMTLLDSYVGGGTRTTQIAWSGKDFINKSPRSTYLASLENIVLDADIVVDFYYNIIGWVPFLAMVDFSPEEQDESLIYYEQIKALTSMTMLYPDFANVNIVSIDGHNAICEWYCTSYKYGKINFYNDSDFEYETEIFAEGLEGEEVLTLSYGKLKDGAIPLGIAPSASASTEDIRNNRGKYFEMKRTWEENDIASVKCDDDIFVTK